MRMGCLINTVFIGLWLLTMPARVAALDGQGIETLKAAGVGDAVIEALVGHRSIETGQLTVAEVIEMKKAGLNDATLQEIIARGSFVNGRSERVYRAEGHGTGWITVEDIIRLKAAGIDEQTLQVLVAGKTPERQDAEMQRACKLLEGWGVVVDRRD